MTLHSLKLKDFRQFKDVQEICFCNRNNDSNANVTVIFGDNGRGKTSIFRAVMFALFGERRLRQDEDISQEELFLVNTVSLNQYTTDNKPLQAFVELTFSHKDTTFKIIRKLAGIIRDGERLEQLGEVLLYETYYNGNTKTYKDPEDINKIVNTVLDRNISEYFLFDGEKIQRLTLASIEQKREIARGIRNLLNIDSLETAIKAFVVLKKKLNAELVSKSSGEYGKVLQKINELDEKRIDLAEGINNCENEYASAVTQKQRIDKQLLKYSEIKHLLLRRDEQEQRLKDLNAQREVLTGEMKTRMGKAPFLFMSDTINDVYSSIDQRKEKGEIPSEIRKDLIERIIEDKRCICGREVKPGTVSFEQIIAWKNKIIDPNLENSALEVWRYLGSVKSHGTDVFNSIKKVLQDFARCEIDIENSRKKISDIGEKIGATEREDASKLEKIRNDIEKKQIEIEAERKRCIQELAELASEYESLCARRERLEQDEHLKSELARRAKIAEETYSALVRVHNDFTKEVRENIQCEANKFFEELLDSESKKTLSRIVVDEDYSLQIIDKWNNKFLANISAGQRQIMSISFISALARVASSGKVLEMPLFMDTPFGRLSLAHRKNLVEKIPTYCSQWILLATDTEFRKEEARLLECTGFWGKFYQLRGEGSGITRIVEKNIEEVNAILLANVEIDYEYVG